VNVRDIVSRQLRPSILLGSTTFLLLGNTCHLSIYSVDRIPSFSPPKSKGKFFPRHDLGLSEVDAPCSPPGTQEDDIAPRHRFRPAPHPGTQTGFFFFSNSSSCTHRELIPSARSVSRGCFRAPLSPCVFSYVACHYFRYGILKFWASSHPPLVRLAFLLCKVGSERRTHWYKESTSLPPVIGPRRLVDHVF